MPAGEITPRDTLAPVVVFGMDEVGRCVVDGLEANEVAYDAVEMDYDRFLAASADGYAVAFGDVGDVRLMETLAMAERSAVVVTVVRYELSKALTPIVRDRYPNLIRFIAVDDDEDRARFEALGMRAVINRSTPRGLDRSGGGGAARRASRRTGSAPGCNASRSARWRLRSPRRALPGMRSALPAALGLPGRGPPAPPAYDKPLPAAWFT